MFVSIGSGEEPISQLGQLLEVPAALLGSWPLPSPTPAMASGVLSHHTTLTLAPLSPLPLLRTLVITLGPSRWSKIIFSSQGPQP